MKISEALTIINLVLGFSPEITKIFQEVFGKSGKDQTCHQIGASEVSIVWFVCANGPKVL